MPSGPGDLDLTIYGFRKYCRMALKGSPTVLLLLFVDGDDVLQCTDLGHELRALTPAFLSKKTGRSFLGYVDAQRRGLIGERHATRREGVSREPHSERCLVDVSEASFQLARRWRMCVAGGECSTSKGSNPRDSTPSKIRSPDPSRTGAMSSVSSSTTPASPTPGRLRSSIRC
jgi:hypothetical protein